MPALLSSADVATPQLAHRLELHWLANREAHAQFALLTDWADAAAGHAARRRSRCWTTRCQRIARAQRALPGRRRARRRASCCCTGPRTWSDTEQRWMGWERKRGKLEMLMRLLATGDASGFLPLAPGMRAGRTHPLRA